MFSGIKIPAPPSIDINYSAPINNFFAVTFVYISALRNEPTIPKAIEQVNILAKNFISRNASKDFLKYILNLYVQYLSAKEAGEARENIERYDKWFENFTNALRTIYDSPELELKADMKNLAFQIKMPGREPFGLHEMADGYTALLDIYMELLMRMDSSDAVVEYDNPAIVMIDEIETHSPFVITSLDNAISRCSIFAAFKRNIVRDDQQLKNLFVLN